MKRRGFGNDKKPAILECLKRLHGAPRLKELDQALLRLHYPIYYNQPVEVMLCTAEEVQIFPMAHPDEDCALSNVYLISYAVIKLSEFGGLYNKVIEQWKSKTK